MSSNMSLDYTVSIVYNKDTSRGENCIEELNRFLNEVAQAQNFISGAIHISNFKYQNGSFIVCIPKTMNDYLSGEGKEICQSNNWNVIRYRVFNKKFNKSVGFYVCKNIDYFIQIMSNLEGKFIVPGSYKIIKPPDDSEGKKRNYIFVVFDENKEGNAPKKFIEKLKVLIENTPVENNNYVKIAWLKNNVYNDYKQGTNKSVKMN